MFSLCFLCALEMTIGKKIIKSINVDLKDNKY